MNELSYETSAVCKRINKKLDRALESYRVRMISIQGDHPSRDISQQFLSQTADEFMMQVRQQN